MLLSNLQRSARQSNYGEMDPASWTSILQNELSEDLTAGKGVFYDLGSGRGQLVFHTALQTRCCKAVGVELSEKRHSMATTALAECKALHPGLQTRIELRKEDVRITDISDATVVYIMNQDMPRRLSEFLWRERCSIDPDANEPERISQIEHPVWILTLVRFRLSEGASPQPVTTITCRQTWSGNQEVPLHLYRHPGRER